MNRLFFAALVGAFATGLAACSPGYMNASELQSKHQGPSDCEARCVELGMRMGALVLVSDALPGCVCQPKPATTIQTPPLPPSEAPKPDPALPAASVSSGSDVVIMTAAVAARVVQTQQQKQKQKSYPN